MISYLELKSQFEKKLKRSLTDEEVEFLKWMYERQRKEIENKYEENST